MLMARKM